MPKKQRRLGRGGGKEKDLADEVSPNVQEESSSPEVSPMGRSQAGGSGAGEVKAEAVPAGPRRVGTPPPVSSRALGVAETNGNGLKLQERKMAMPSNGNNNHVVRPQVINNGIKLVGEVLLPGASELLEGRIGRGAFAAGVGLVVPAVSAAVFGPVAALVVGGGASLGARLFSYYDSLQPEGAHLLPSSSPSYKSPKEELDFQFIQGKISEGEYKRKKLVLESP
jgi:hypothetical protein